MRRSGLRACPLLLLCAALAAPADKPLLPGNFGKFTLRQSAPAPPLDAPAVASEYGVDAAETATYTGPQKLTVTVWRLKDSTGALAFYQWQHGQPGSWLQAGNYILHFEGARPRKDALRAFTAALPPVPAQPLPVLPTYLPGTGLIPGTERYILGAASLNQFQPRVSPELARFDLGAEAQLGKYRTAAGDVDLGIFSYPTPQIARLQLKEFEKLEGATARRSGPMVVVAFGPAAGAVKLADSVQYQASVVLNEATKDYSGNPGDMLIAIFQMIGYILLFCMGAGLVVAGIRRVQDYGFGNTRAAEPMITLHLQDK